MAKPTTIKFPRIHAGFYSVTQDGELRGYIMKEETDDKVTNWYVFDNNTPDMDIATLHPEDAIDSPDELFREAKESAKTYFLKTPPKDMQVATPVVIPEAEWSDTQLDEEDGSDDWQENTIEMEMDDDGIEFELITEDDELTEEQIDEALALV